jgi:hypothetical protein
MKNNEGVKNFSSNPLIMRIQVGRKNAYDIKSFYPPQLDANDKAHFSLDHIKKLYEGGVNYLVLDHLKYRYDNVLVSATERVRPVFAAFHSWDADMYETGYVGIERYGKNPPNKIEVYKIEDLLKEISRFSSK